MQVKRFVAADMRRALEMVRHDLGPDAIILSSNRIPEGVELLTTMGSDYELEQLQARPLSDVTFSPSQPLLSDGDVTPRALAKPERRPQTQVRELPGRSQAAVADVETKGSQLARDIERAHERMLAARSAEASAKEFLLPQKAAASEKPRTPARFLSAQAAEAAAASASFKESLNAAERYNLQDHSSRRRDSDAPKLSPEAIKLRDSLVQESERQRENSRAAERLFAPKSLGGRRDDMEFAKIHPAPTKDPVVAEEKSVPAPAEVAVRAPVDQVQLEDLQAEIADMRLLLEQQLSRLSGQVDALPSSPILASIGRRLERLGLSDAVVSRALSQTTKAKTLNQAWPEALANVARQISVSGEDIVDRGGVFALVGPTGAGKTTTIGKLAARYVLKHGADKVALITTDTYRIAAHDQLRSIARILRVPVRVVDEAHPLEQVLQSLRQCDLVLIDTAGFRHGDPYLKSQLTALAQHKEVQTLLVMPCNSQEQMLKASVHAYGAAGLAGCVLTKLDETASMGEALNVVIHHKLTVAYTTDGQDVPKNIDVARAHSLVTKATSLLKATSARVAVK